MSRSRPLLAQALAGAVLVLAPGLAAGATPAGGTVTATGSATVAVKVATADRQKNAAILAAVRAAHDAAIPKALADAREEAGKLASAAGLSLGAVQSISEPSANLPYGGPSNYEIGPFGPGRFCGTIRRPVFHRDSHGRRHVVRFRRVHRCIVPGDQTVEVEATFGAS